jgi:acyl-CoA synthetase (AMP-forming)/AMP-acid ligase II
MSLTPSLAFNNLNALLIDTWTRHGNREVMDDGSEVVSYNTLMRRVMALSCFIDECAGTGRGPVVLYLPAGLWSVRCLLATWMTGRAALPIEAVAEARRGPTEHPHGRYFEPHRPQLDQLDEKPSLVITLAPLARIAEGLIRQASFESCPLLYANDISRMMDIGHQERIRARLQPAWLESRAELDASRPALWTEDAPGSEMPEEGAPRALRSHAEVLSETERHLNRLDPLPSRFLSMTSISKTGTWTCSTLSCLALGGRQSFIRFFHPRHVLDVIQRDRIDHLWMSPVQYHSLTPLLESHRPTWRIQCGSDDPAMPGIVPSFEATMGSSLRWVDDTQG